MSKGNNTSNARQINHFAIAEKIQMYYTRTMINPTDTSPDSKELAIAALSADTHDALSQSARLNGRSLHEEAEHIIRSHLRTASLEEPVNPDHV